MITYKNIHKDRQTPSHIKYTHICKASTIMSSMPGSEWNHPRYLRASIFSLPIHFVSISFCGCGLCAGILGTHVRTCLLTPAPVCSVLFLTLGADLLPLSWYLCYRVPCHVWALAARNTALGSICRDTSCLYTQKQNTFSLGRCHEFPTHLGEFVLPPKEHEGHRCSVSLPKVGTVHIFNFIRSGRVRGLPPCNFRALPQ